MRNLLIGFFLFCVFSGAGHSQERMVHEMVVCNDRMLAVLAKDSYSTFQIMAKMLDAGICAGSRFKFTQDDIILSEERKNILEIMFNTDNNFEYSGLARDVIADVELSTRLNLPKTYIEFVDENERSQFVDSLEQGFSLRMAFDSADTDVADFLSFNSRIVPFYALHFENANLGAIPLQKGL